MNARADHLADRMAVALGLSRTGKLFAPAHEERTTLREVELRLNAFRHEQLTVERKLRRVQRLVVPALKAMLRKRRAHQRELEQQ